MRKARPTIFLGDRSISLWLLLTLFLSSCGLGMNNEVRLQRAQEAFDNGEYRAAIIDSKNVLLDEPENIAARLLLGRASLEVGDGVSAEKELRRAVDLGADYGVVVADLSRALLAQGKFEEVIAEIDPELSATPAGRLSVMQSRGEALVALGKPEAAREVFTEILAVDPSDIPAQLGIVQSYVAERNYLQARDMLDQVVAAAPDHIQSWLAAGALSLRSRDTERAVREYGRAAELARQRGNTTIEIFAIAGMTDALFAQNSADQVRPQLARMQEINAEDMRTMLVAARLAATDQDWSKAQELLQEILRRAPRFRQAQMLLGFVHKESGNLGQAEMYLSAAVAAAPDDPMARRLLAETRLQMNKAEDARKALAPLLEANDADVNSLSMAAGASMVLGEFDAATELMERVVAADPSNIEQQMQLALMYFRGSKAAKAQEVLEAIPDNLEEGDEFRRASLLVLTKMAQGNREEALADAQGLLQQWPSRPAAHNLVGSIEMSNGNNAAARSHFNTAYEVAPDDMRSIRLLAQLDELEGDYEAATSRYELILTKTADDVRSMVALAKLAARREDPDATRDWLTKASEAAPTAIAPLQLLGNLHLALREFEDAERVLARALELQPDSAGLLSLMGYAQLGKQDMAAAEANFARALELSPDVPVYRLNLAKAQTAGGDREAAIATMEGKMEQTMQHLPSAAYLAALKADGGDLDGALAISARLREEYPNESVPHALEGELKARSGNLIEAAAEYDKALELEATQRNAMRAYQIRTQASLGNPTSPLVKYLEERPFDANIRVVLAQAFQNEGQLGKANTQYERILEDDPNHFVAANNLAWNYFQSGDSRAEGLARQAYNLQPDNGAVVDTLGWILAKKGKLEEGIGLLRDAAEKSGNRPDVRYHLAVALVDAGEPAEAKSILEEVLSADTAFSSRKEAEELLASL